MGRTNLQGGYLAALNTFKKIMLAMAMGLRVSNHTNAHVIRGPVTLAVAEAMG